MSRVVGLSCALLLGGCSLVWGVDPDRFRDGGMDASVDDGGVDGGEGGPGDAGDAGDAMQCAARFERDCNDGDDDDCDGLVDCNDFDCATDLIQCCDARGPLFPVEDFDPAPAWRWLGGEVPQTPGALEFGGSGSTHALQVPECIPIDLGVRISVRMHLVAAPVVCDDGSSDCENYGAIVITEEQALSDGSLFPANLAVRLDREGHAQIHAAAGDVLLDSADDAVTFGAAPIDVTISLTPGADDEGRPQVFATVTLVQGTTITWPSSADPERRFTTRAAFPRSYLLGDILGCTAARGLLLAFEGAGPQVSIDRVSVEQFGCANPSHFQPVRAIGVSLDADDLDGTLSTQDSSDWTVGGLGSPAIQSFFPDDGPTERTELLYDASNRDRTLEGRDDVHYSIGGAWTTDPDSIGPYTPRAGGAPMIGLRPPDCLGTAMPPEGCASLRSVREAALFVPVTEDRVRMGTMFPLVFARERTTDGAFEIAGATAYWNDMRPSAFDTPIAAPDDQCLSMRDPVIVPTGPGSTEDLIVLYTCERRDAPSSIRALQLDEFPPTDTGVTRIAGEVIDPAMLGAIAVGGVRAADAAVWFHDGEVVLRVWFISEDLSRDPATISFAEGSGPLGELPTLHLYAANPVLRSGDPLLGTCPAAGCSIESVAVTRLANSPNTVRLMISRTPEPASGIEHVLVPLDQVWPALD